MPPKRKHASTISVSVRSAIPVSDTELMKPAQTTQESDINNETLRVGESEVKHTADSKGQPGTSCGSQTPSSETS